MRKYKETILESEVLKRAARYTFLRDQSEVDLGVPGEPVIALPFSAGDYLSGKDADEAIDAAMERKRAKDAEFMRSTLTVPK